MQIFRDLPPVIIDIVGSYLQAHLNLFLNKASLRDYAEVAISLDSIKRPSSCKCLVCAAKFISQLNIIHVGTHLTLHSDYAICAAIAAIGNSVAMGIALNNPSLIFCQDKMDELVHISIKFHNERQTLHQIITRIKSNGTTLSFPSYLRSALDSYNARAFPILHAHAKYWDSMSLTLVITTKAVTDKFKSLMTQLDKQTQAVICREMYNSIYDQRAFNHPEYVEFLLNTSRS